MLIVPYWTRKNRLPYWTRKNRLPYWSRKNRLPYWSRKNRLPYWTRKNRDTKYHELQSFLNIYWTFTVTMELERGLPNVY